MNQKPYPYQSDESIGISAGAKISAGPKHQILQSKISDLESVLAALDSLNAQISLEPPREAKTCDPNHSLEGVLNEGPEAIERFIDNALALIEEINQKLF